MEKGGDGKRATQERATRETRETRERAVRKAKAFGSMMITHWLEWTRRELSVGGGQRSSSAVEQWRDGAGGAGAKAGARAGAGAGAGGTGEDLWAVNYFYCEYASIPRAR